jgi:glycosyltransferase involved in cell wall biosynthesis
LRLAVVSPFLDRQHGTERCVIEQLERFAARHDAEVHLYCERTEGLRGLHNWTKTRKAQPGEITLHQVAGIPGPHLLRFVWWYFANQRKRRDDQRKKEISPDLVYSPGINCPDADVIVVHIVFHAFYASVRPQLRFARVPWSRWPLVLHRRIYYRLIMALENKIYRNPRVDLIAVAPLVAAQLREHFGRQDVVVIPNAVDTREFTRSARQTHRAEARKKFGFSEEEFVLLLIGNDWKKKGLDALLEALPLLKDIRPRLLVVGADEPRLYRARVAELQLEAAVQFSKPSSDVLFFYAAADAYVGPSLEDAFGLPVLEAMACGLPAISSGNAGVSHYVADGETGFLLNDPQDPAEIAGFVRRLHGDAQLRETIGQAAARFTEEHCSWDQNAVRTMDFFKMRLARKQEALTAGAGPPKGVPPDES